MSDMRENPATQPKSVGSGGGLERRMPLYGMYSSGASVAWLERVKGRVPRVVGYVRVSTEDQALGLSLGSQTVRIGDEVAARGWELVRVEEDHASGKSTNRPAFQRVLDGLAAREYDALMFGRLDRLSRSIMDFCLIVDRAHRQGWAIVSLEPAIDMTSPFGRTFAQLMVVFAEFERAMIGERQKESIAARKRAGTYKSPPVLMGAEVEERILHLASEGFGARRIARQLGLEGYKPPRAAVWQPSTVQVALRRLRASEAA